jgi:hypothetical protein
MSPKFQLSGFTEAVVIVRSATPHLACWSGVGGWEVRHHGTIDNRLLCGWGVPEARGEEWLLGRPGLQSGFVRLVRLDNAGVQSDMRPDDQCWDVGGIFDLNVRVLDMQKQSAALRDLQWSGASPPVQWDFGSVTVKEWLVRGPDNVRLALIERVAPPLTGMSHLKGLGPVFNSSLIVDDLEAAQLFWCGTLGFKNYVSFDLAHFPPGPNVFGVPANLSSQVGLRLHILHPEGRNDGSIEIVRVAGAQGLDWSETCRPPNFGMASLRFPVQGMEALAQHLTEHHCAPVMPVVVTSLAPYGDVRMLAVRAPGGAWIEFYEPLA